MKVFILGGGPAGLALAQGLAEDTGVGFELFERQNTLGGLAQTLQWGEHGAHDLGPHKIFTLDDKLMRRVLDLLPPGDWLERPKRSQIWIKGHFLPYPPSPFSLINVFGKRVFVRMVSDYGTAQVRARLPHAEPKTFGADLRLRVGATLFERLFKPIAVKLWGDPDTLDVKLSRGRVQTPNLVEVLQRVLGLKTSSSSFEALTFRYPRGGLGQLWAAIAKRCEGKGTLNTGVEVVHIRHAGGRITGLTVKKLADGSLHEHEVGPEDRVFSTLPMTVLLDAMVPAPDPSLRARAERLLTLNDLLLVFLKIDKPSLFDDSWVFVPDPDVAFHRVSQQRSFDPGMTPGGSIVCCEVMSHALRPWSDKDDQSLRDAVVQGLHTLGYQGFAVEDFRVIRLPRSYPVYRSDFQGDLDAVLQAMDGIANLRTIGRQGAFNYIGTLDAMDIGYGAARWLKASAATSSPQSGTATWATERERTSHYPVLD